jgi:hypothetical protein
MPIQLVLARVGTIDTRMDRPRSGRHKWGRQFRWPLLAWFPASP